MAADACDGCGRSVHIAGGIAGIWSPEPGPSAGLTLVLEDGSEHLLCFDCVEALPEDPAAADVRALGG